MGAIRAAIYARYSSDSQREESLEDQITMCIDYAKKNNFIIDRNQNYTDTATPGSLRNRPGLDNLVQDANERLFDVILVDDLSRISRGIVQLSALIQEFNFIGISLHSVADNLVASGDEEPNRTYQLKGINESFLDTPRMKIIRIKGRFFMGKKADKSDKDLRHESD